MATQNANYQSILVSDSTSSDTVESTWIVPMLPSGRATVNICNTDFLVSYRGSAPSVQSIGNLELAPWQYFKLMEGQKYYYFYCEILQHDVLFIRSPTTFGGKRCASFVTDAARAITRRSPVIKNDNNGYVDVIVSSVYCEIVDADAGAAASTQTIEQKTVIRYLDSWMWMNRVNVIKGDQVTLLCAGIGGGDIQRYTNSMFERVELTLGKGIRSTVHSMPPRSLSVDKKISVEAIRALCTDANIVRF